MKFQIHRFNSKGRDDNSTFWTLTSSVGHVIEVDISEIVQLSGLPSSIVLWKFFVLCLNSKGTNKILRFNFYPTSGSCDQKSKNLKCSKSCSLPSSIILRSFKSTILKVRVLITKSKFWTLTPFLGSVSRNRKIWPEQVVRTYVHRDYEGRLVF